MSERKVLNKYYPPDFDVTKLPKLKLSRDRQFVIRIMAPFSMRCKTCGDYIYKGRKFNAREETVKDESYLGLRIYRFYIRCPKCLSEITFKTDPENTDYIMEEGAIRNFEAFRLAKRQEERLKQEKEEEELNNPMKALENRTMESRQEMAMLEKLEELKDINARHAAVDHDQLIRDHILVNEEEMKRKQEEEDEALVKSVFGTRSDGYVKRLDDGDDDDAEEINSVSTTKNEESETRKRVVTDLLTEQEPDSAVTTKKPKNDQGIVAFSKLKTATVIRKKPTTNSQATSVSKSGSSKSEQNLKDGGISINSVSSNADAKPSCSNSEDKASGTLDKEKGSSSLSLLGTYDSSSNSEDSD